MACLLPYNGFDGEMIKVKIEQANWHVGGGLSMRF